MAPGTAGQVPPPTKKMRPETLGEVRERAQAVYGMDCDSPSSSDESPDPESTTPWGQENDKDHVSDKDDTDDGEWQCVDKSPAEDDAGKTKAVKAMSEKKKHFVYQADTSTTSSTSWAQPGFEKDDISAEEISDEACLLYTSDAADD